MALAEDYWSPFKLIRETLEFEDPPGQWSYFVYCTYSAHFAETYYANLIPQTIPDVQFSDCSAAPASAFDRFVVDRFQSHISNITYLVQGAKKCTMQCTWTISE